jgi:hypothetical protein
MLRFTQHDSHIDTFAFFAPSGGVTKRFNDYIVRIKPSCRMKYFKYHLWILVCIWILWVLTLVSYTGAFHPYVNNFNPLLFLGFGIFYIPQYSLVIALLVFFSAFFRQPRQWKTTLVLTLGHLLMSAMFYVLVFANAVKGASVGAR